MDDIEYHEEPHHRGEPIEAVDVKSGARRIIRVCPTRTPEVHNLGEFPMTCYNCHVAADS